MHHHLNAKSKLFHLTAFSIDSLKQFIQVFILVQLAYESLTSGSCANSIDLILIYGLKLVHSTPERLNSTACRRSHLRVADRTEDSTSLRKTIRWP